MNVIITFPKDLILFIYLNFKRGESWYDIYISTCTVWTLWIDNPIINIMSGSQFDDDRYDDIYILYYICIWIAWRSKKVTCEVSCMVRYC